MAVQLQSREEKQWINCPKFNFIKCSGTQKSLKPWFRRTESWREFVPDMWCVKPERLFSLFFFFYMYSFNSREENSEQTRPGWSENVWMVRNRAADQKCQSVCYKPAVGFQSWFFGNTDSQWKDLRPGLIQGLGLSEDASILNLLQMFYQLRPLKKTRLNLDSSIICSCGSRCGQMCQYWSTYNSPCHEEWKWSRGRCHNDPSGLLRRIIKCQLDLSCCFVHKTEAGRG